MWQAMQKLEFPQVLEALAQRCHFSVSAERARTVIPATTAPAVRELLAITDESVEITIDLPGISVGGARDIRPLIDRAEKGARLLPAELQDVAGTLAAARAVRQQVLTAADAATRFPRLVDHASALALMPHFEEAIRRSIGPGGEVLDTASERLGRIRREIRLAHQRLLDRLNRMIASGPYTAALQDHLITTRDGRYVIPVRADARGQAPGIVHDTSASGQTLFVEPIEVVELNNRWREAQLEEQHEIDRILDELSAQVGGNAAALGQTVESLAELDLALAKARLAVDWRATRSQLIAPDTGRTRFHFRQARHPLLDPESVVPIDVEAGDTFRVLLITGPNTGGKTVALKTIGLMTLMAQSGLYVTAADGSATSVFDRVLVDIGDDQSIAQSLSTFSSHMTNVISMLEEATERSLVLIDELGTGTDPQEGSAIARAVVAELVDRDAVAVATTHFSEVKAFAYEHPEVENASVEFDVETLTPTFRLLLGIPGQSNALAIARRLGMPERVLERASTFLSPDAVRVDALLADIQEKRARAEEALARANVAESNAATLAERRSRELEEAQQLRFQAYEEAQAEAESMLLEGRRSLKRLQKAAATHPAPQDDRTPAHQEVAAIDAVRASVREAASRTRRRQPRTIPLAEGDRVRVRSLSQEGTLVRLGSDEGDVQLGVMRITRPLADLDRLGGPPKTVAAPVRVQGAGGFVPIELDLRGFRYVELEPELDRYLDAAYRASLPFVRIIHGKGSGALRKGVADYLRSSPIVERFEAGRASEGGDGVTVVHFRE
jgi:DNA mismatch repair protein MutS2